MQLLYLKQQEKKFISATRAISAKQVDEFCNELHKANKKSVLNGQQILALDCDIPNSHISLLFYDIKNEFVALRKLEKLKIPFIHYDDKKMTESSFLDLNSRLNFNHPDCD